MKSNKNIVRVIAIILIIAMLLPVLINAFF